MAVRQELPKDFKKFPHGFPTRENCDPANPYEAFLWMLVAWPYMNGAQLVMPVDYLQFVSKRLWDAGAMLECTNCGHRKPPTIKYQKPLGTDPNALSSPGRWVDVDAPDRDSRRPVEIAVDSLVNQQASELSDELIGRMSAARLRAAMTDEQRKALGLEDDK